MTGLSACQGCGSQLVQPLRSQPQRDGSMLVDLRCPECFASLRVGCTRAEMAELDRRQAGSRETLVRAYERFVAENMEALEVCFGAALALDLIGPDDFALRPA